MATCGRSQSKPPAKTVASWSSISTEPTSYLQPPACIKTLPNNTWQRGTAEHSQE